jgi:hypothetical protein
MSKPAQSVFSLARTALHVDYKNVERIAIENEPSSIFGKSFLDR